MCGEDLDPTCGEGTDDDLICRGDPMMTSCGGGDPMMTSCGRGDPMMTSCGGRRPNDDHMWGRRPNDDHMWGRRPNDDLMWGRRLNDDLMWGEGLHKGGGFALRLPPLNCAKIVKLSTTSLECFVSTLKEKQDIILKLDVEILEATISEGDCH